MNEHDVFSMYSLNHILECVIIIIIRDVSGVESSVIFSLLFTIIVHTRLRDVPIIALNAKLLLHTGIASQQRIFFN